MHCGYDKFSGSDEQFCTVIARKSYVQKEYIYIYKSGTEKAPVRPSTMIEGVLIFKKERHNTKLFKF